MKRTFYSFPVTDASKLKDQLLEWVAKFDKVCFLDNNNYTSPYNSFDCLVGAGCSQLFQPGEAFFASLADFVNSTNDWIFAHLNFDCKCTVESRHSDKTDFTHFPDYSFFVPKLVIQLKDNAISIGVIDADANDVLQEILQQEIVAERNYTAAFKSRVLKNEYVTIINKLKEHIKHGDCYELNFCQEFYADKTYINPVNVYRQLTKKSPNPFSCFYKLHNKYVLCASPERYLKKEGHKLISQPIKGTAARDLNNREQDEQNKLQLLLSEKERRENVIVVDLVRNDLSMVCEEGTVEVKELFGIYTFPTVHQMISTVTGRLKANTDIAEIIKATFPMGSMTGAPKKRVLQLIKQYEKTKRGIYSGTIGYISPAKDFDFNVVIRSIVYNAETEYLSYHTGSGITYWSDPNSEYEECLTKAAAVFSVFAGK